MTPVQRKRKLRENLPDERLGSARVFQPQVLDESTKVSAATELHIKVQVLALLKMLPVVKCNNIGVAQAGEDGKLGVQLLALFVAHFGVGDLFPAHYQAIGLVANLVDLSEHALACDVKVSRHCGGGGSHREQKLGGGMAGKRLNAPTRLRLSYWLSSDGVDMML